MRYVLVKNFCAEVAAAEQAAAPLREKPREKRSQKEVIDPPLPSGVTECLRALQRFHGHWSPADPGRDFDERPRHATD